MLVDSPRLLFVGAALALLPLGCAERVPGRGADSSRPASAPVAWRFEAPARWGDRVQVEVDVRDASRSARSFMYVPADSTVPRHAILSIAVYDTAAWRASGLDPNDTLAIEGAQVFAVRRARTQPYAAGSREARVFDSLLVSIDEARRAFRVLR